MTVTQPPGLTLTATRYAPGDVLAEHYHERATLSVVFRGAYEERVGRARHLCGPLGILYKPPGVTHSNHVGGAGLEALFVEVEPWRREEMADVGAAPSDACGVRSPRARGLAARVARELRMRGPAHALVVEELLLEAWLEVARVAVAESQPMPPWLARARDYLHAHPAAAVTLRELAAAAGVHPVYLAARFRRQFGCSVGEYVRRLRLELACDRLAEPHRGIGRIGLDLGFADHSHFVRTFRSRVGVTPSEYRRCVRGE